MKFKIVKSIKTLLFFIALGVMAYSCENEPFPAAPVGAGNDTIKDPNDTTQNPIDTTKPGKPCHPDTVYYERDIQPILTASCAFSGCHDAVTREDGVQLTDYNSVMNTADVRPGNLSGSDLYEVITDNDPDDRMPPPPRNALSPSQITLIAKWINQGALNLKCDDCETTNLTYANGIKAIFDNNCAICHKGAFASAGLSLTTYQEVKDALVSPLDLLIRINGGDNSNPTMPQGGKMPQCNIDKIEAWYNNGMPQ
ncbi:c-type cytochrome domain-containing protein [Owenweeksia hongkongensis]|uniref:c-type cytochrome domain-containing protein n=1 Tax=Owenweeksia hongkongensis TaxID=253245 RepID=UPI003A947EF1